MNRRSPYSTAAEQRKWAGCLHTVQLQSKGTGQDVSIHYSSRAKEQDRGLHTVYSCRVNRKRKVGLHTVQLQSNHGQEVSTQYSYRAIMDRRSPYSTAAEQTGTQEVSKHCNCRANSIRRRTLHILQQHLLKCECF
jgi:hypothetical protein